MNKEELYTTILNSPTHKYSLLNEIYAIRDTRVENQDYSIGVNGFISLDVLLENYNQINIIEDLQHQLEEKDKVIGEIEKRCNQEISAATIQYERHKRNDIWQYIIAHKRILEILEGGKSEK